MKKPQPRLRLSASEVQERYGISRGKLDLLVAQGHLVPERILGSGQKRYFRPEQIEALFRKPAPPKGAQIDIGAIGDEAYFNVFGHWPKRRHSSVH